MGSPEGGSHEGSSPRAFLTDGEHTSMGTSTYLKISSFSFLHSFLLVFLNFPDMSLFLCFESFLIHIIKKNLSMGTWERRNIARSPPLHNSLGIFCWGRSLKIQREIKREVFTLEMGSRNAPIYLRP